MQGSHIYLKNWLENYMIRVTFQAFTKKRSLSCGKGTPSQPCFYFSARFDY